MGGGPYCHQKEQCKGAVMRKMAHFGKGINRFDKCAGGEVGASLQR